jgi:ribosomal protein S1
VRSLVDFGAFVNLGGIDGLIHISELDWRFVEHPSGVLSVGDEVEVLILSVDRERERIGLSRKRLQLSPWDRWLGEVQEGDLVEGTVTKVKPFGVFVHIGQGIEGLVRAANTPVNLAVSELEAGSPVTVRILDIEEENQKVALEIPPSLPV